MYDTVDDTQVMFLEASLPSQAVDGAHDAAAFTSGYGRSDFYALESEEPDQDAFELSSPRTVNIG